jgi:carboxy-terminal domain RNA polymerase II polypeptide A small phosphatase
MSELYEIVIFTASVSSYASPIINLIDQNKKVEHRLFRYHCKKINEALVKDLSKLGRNLKDIILGKTAVNFSR